MRVMAHNGRVGKDGAYSARHNDRNFGQRKENNNVYWQCNDAQTFEDCEMQFYQEHFGQALDSQNKRYEDNRHKERIKTVEQYHTSPRTCPEEEIFQVGDKDSHISSEELIAIYKEHLAWRREHFPQVEILDWALHTDETTPHIHERRVWISHNKDGQEIVSQSKALDDMGIERPDPSKDKDRHNNPKMIYTQLCRENIEEITRQHGIVLPETRLDKSRVGLELVEFKTRQEQEKAIELDKENEAMRKFVGGVMAEIRSISESTKDALNVKVKETLFGEKKYILSPEEWDRVQQALRGTKMTQETETHLKEIIALTNTYAIEQGYSQAIKEQEAQIAKLKEALIKANTELSETREELDEVDDEVNREKERVVEAAKAAVQAIAPNMVAEWKTAAKLYLSNRRQFDKDYPDVKRQQEQEAQKIHHSHEHRSIH